MNRSNPTTSYRVLFMPYFCAAQKRSEKNMQKTKLWEIIPLNQPNIIKSCSKCGNKSNFISTGNFRINANQNKIDVWLIYQCEKCKTTWNMAILSRVNSSSISTDLYQKFLCNDAALAWKYAFDANIHSQNKVVSDYKSIEYEIKGDTIPFISLAEPVQIQLKCDFLVDIRLDKILSEKVQISRTLIKKLSQSGNIRSNKGKEIWKDKISNDLLITIYP
jgi:hypothetical protein